MNKNRGHSILTTILAVGVICATVSLTTLNFLVPLNQPGKDSANATLGKLRFYMDASHAWKQSVQASHPMKEDIGFTDELHFRLLDSILEVFYAKEKVDQLIGKEGHDGRLWVICGALQKLNCNSFDDLSVLIEKHEFLIRTDEFDEFRLFVNEALEQAW